MSIKLIETKNPGKHGVAVISLLKRYGILILVPILLTSPVYGIYTSGTATVVVFITLLVLLSMTVWSIGNIVLIVKRKDPWFDRWSGLAEIIVPKAEALVMPGPSAAPPPLPHP
jgi:hypothetical protein